jgi:hypothetical protein
MKLTQGVHYKSLTSNLSVEKTREVLAVLDRPEILAALEKHPIQRIIIARLGDKIALADYVWSDKTLTLNSGLKPGVHFGEDFIPGQSGNLSAATVDRIESMRRSMLHETAHHLQNAFPVIGNIVSEAFANPAKRCITRYASRLAVEYFAESFVAFVICRDLLESFIP